MNKSQTASNSRHEITGRVPFEIKTEWRAWCNGYPETSLPLIVYLHGYGENIERFRKQTQTIQGLHAWHLFISGPYPLPHPGMKNRGFSWYIYDGADSDFVRELQNATNFVETVVEEFRNYVDHKPYALAVVGFSMGAYLAGYWALFGQKPPDYVAACAGRIKTELLKPDSDLQDKSQQIMAFHGKEDPYVKGERQEKAIEELKGYGLHAEIRWLNCGHQMSGEMEEAVSEWLSDKINY